MLNKEVLQNLRMNYIKASFDEKDALDNPFDMFKIWFNQALESEVPEPNAFTLATVDSNGHPNARIMLLKSIDEGFVFFTNYLSDKGKELINHPYASYVFLWLELERQVRIRGRIVKVTEQMNEDYFNSRPIGSRVGAIVSRQSEELKSRNELEQAFKVWDAKPESEITRPENWGGFRLIPDYFEFWQGRESRLHDRIAYSLKNQIWNKSRLYP
jgi:pyridoxamine 5'-phosphate oxidase